MEEAGSEASDLKTEATKLAEMNEERGRLSKYALVLLPLTFVASASSC